MALSQSTLESPPYCWRFTTLAQKGNVVVASRRQRGAMRELVAANIAAAVARASAIESYWTTANVSASQF